MGYFLKKGTKDVFAVVSLEGQPAQIAKIATIREGLLVALPQPHQPFDFTSSILDDFVSLTVSASPTEAF